LLVRKLVRFALNFLHGKDIGVGSFKPGNHTIYAGADGVYVVGGDAHTYKVRCLAVIIWHEITPKEERIG
jgi:hypothetical protein